MKPYLVLPVTTVVSVALFAYMRSAETDRERQNRLMRFQDIKLRVTYDVLTEYEKEASEGQAPIDQANEKQKSLEMAVNDLRNQNEKAKQESEDCLQFKVRTSPKGTTQVNKTLGKAPSRHCGSGEGKGRNVTVVRRGRTGLG